MDEKILINKNKASKLIQNLISENKWLISFIEKHWREGQTYYRKYDEFKNIDKDLQKIIRHLKWALPMYINKNIFDFEPFEVMFVKFSGLSIVNDIFVDKVDRRAFIEQQKQLLKEKGYLFNEHDIDFGTSIAFEGYVFESVKSVMKFLFEVVNLEEVIIDESFVSQINTKFNAEITGVRALCARMEDWEFSAKIENNHFRKKRSNEKQIAEAIHASISKIDFNFLNKDLFMLINTEIIDEYNLKLDEPYYIFKKFYSEQYFFSKGNSMFISRNETLANLSGAERIKAVYQLPKVVSFDQFAFDTGLSYFAKINFDNVFAIGKNNLFIYDENNEKHLQFIYKKFLPLFRKNVGVPLMHSDIKNGCEFSDDKFLNEMAMIYSYKFLEKPFSDKLKLKSIPDGLRGANKTSYIYKPDGLSNDVKYINIDDWGEI